MNILDIRNPPKYWKWTLQKIEEKKLCLNFAKKALMHVKFNDWFIKNDDMANKTKFLEVVSRQKKLQKSPIPYLTRLLNENNV